MKEINYQFLKNPIKPRPYNAHKGSMGSLLSTCGNGFYSRDMVEDEY